MKKTVVLYPGLAVSHFVPMVQLADVLLEEGYAVVVAFVDPIVKGDIALAAVVDRVAASKPSVAFHKLPRIRDLPAFVHDANFVVRYFDLVGRYHQHLHEFLLSMPNGGVHSLILDLMSIEVLDVTSKLTWKCKPQVPLRPTVKMPLQFAAELRDVWKKYRVHAKDSVVGTGGSRTVNPRAKGMPRFGIWPGRSCPAQEIKGKQEVYYIKGWRGVEVNQLSGD
ncbi:hypothetical protein HU200_026677 [Digitaria exilis]|uniref:Uncharacterized protein n=1 Tax=Digitaria exilis TaxID=1010633 RepID=A0A835EU16_9POAL|nr:hypothetical protein HU200_026677 [Digitaria exilis]